jgi:AGZA family xanthine/uracil permease-like MFS transporter
VLAGVTTFVTMAYIVFVQPAVLGAAGMDPGAVFMATCLASAFATRLWAAVDYPSLWRRRWGNFLRTVVLASGTRGRWRSAVAIAGIVFVLTAGVGLREHVIAAVPASPTRHAGTAAHCLTVQWAGIIVDTPGTMVGLGDLTSTLRCCRLGRCC